MRMAIAVILMVIIFIENQLPAYAAAQQTSSMYLASEEIQQQQQEEAMAAKLEEWVEEAEAEGKDIATTEPEAAAKAIEAEKYKANPEEIGATAATDSMVSFAEKAIDDIKNTGRGGGSAALLKVFSVITTVIGVGQDIYTMNHLTGEHVVTQTLQVTSLLADIAVLVSSMMGWLAFPWSLLAGLAVSMLVEFLNNENTAKALDDLFSWMEWLYNDVLYNMKLPHFINVLKPNIYIYSDTSQPVDVLFTQPELLTTSIPDYNTGWQVTTGANGELTDASGETYGFLFYESKSRPELFQKEAGYRIGADTRAEQFETILTEMGFNEQEIADFIEFWTTKLDAGVDYIMYPQDTPVIDVAMPMEITPQPKSIERIWFYFIADNGQKVKTPETIILERDNAYSVVEWGGMVE